MGAWGHKPYENDSALDWLFEVEKPMVKTITAALKRVKAGKRGDYYHEGIAAAQLLLDHCRAGHLPDLSYEAMRSGVFAYAVLAIETIQADDAWIEEWKTPDVVRWMLKSMRRALLIRRAVEVKRAAKIKLRIVSRRKYSPRKKVA